MRIECIEEPLLDPQDGRMASRCRLGFHVMNDPCRNFSNTFSGTCSYDDVDVSRRTDPSMWKSIEIGCVRLQHRTSQSFPQIADGLVDVSWMPLETESNSMSVP